MDALVAAGAAERAGLGIGASTEQAALRMGSMNIAEQGALRFGAGNLAEQATMRVGATNFAERSGHTSNYLSRITQNRTRKLQYLAGTVD